jgi:hypothetical protein
MAFESALMALSVARESDEAIRLQRDLARASLSANQV